jgi:putative SbcD/Mre11-related phosphoesterase
MIRVLNDWLLLPQRVALHEPSATAVIADVHLGYSAARQRLGDAVPLRSVADEMHLLADAASLHDITSLVVAGDLFERGYDASIYQQFLDVLTDLCITFHVLVPGNHDRGIDKATTPLPLHADGFDLAGWRVVHGDQKSEHSRRIMGHWHPAIRLRRRKLPCFLVRDKSLILPAFSLDAAGADIFGNPELAGWDAFGIERNKVVRVRPTKKPRVATRGL